MSNYKELTNEFLEDNKLVRVDPKNTDPYQDKIIYTFNTSKEVMSRNDIEGELVIILDDPSWVYHVKRNEEGVLHLQKYCSLRSSISNLVDIGDNSEKDV